MPASWWARTWWSSWPWWISSTPPSVSICEACHLGNNAHQSKIQDGYAKILTKHTVDNLHLTTLTRHVMVGVTRSKAILVFSKSLVVSKTETGWVVFWFETNLKFKKHITSHTSQLQTQGKGIGLKFPRLQINIWTKHRKCLLIVPLFFVLLDLCICNIFSVFVFCFFYFFVRFLFS